jgi:NitT/TauT family transport system substrate-binding protein
MHSPRLSAAVTVVIASLMLATAACGQGSGAAASTPPLVTMRLGYFPNVTHAPALYGISTGTFAAALGPQVRLEPVLFDAGPELINALFSDAVDVAFVGPGPTINGWAKSHGEALRIVAGTTSGGAYLMAQPSIHTAADLKGKKVATPQLGNTQDVALRAWLLSQGLTTDTTGGGDVEVTPQSNADTLSAFAQGQIAGAWVPEPWATRLSAEAGGKVLVDERTLWPSGEYVTTQLVVSQSFLRRHGDIVERLLRGLITSIDTLSTDRPAASKAVNAAIADATGKPLPERVLRASLDNLTFTIDPLAVSLAKDAANAEMVGVADHVDLTGIHDLTILNRLLAAAGIPEVPGI